MKMLVEKVVLEMRREEAHQAYDSISLYHLPALPVYSAATNELDGCVPLVSGRMAQQIQSGPGVLEKATADCQECHGRTAHLGVAMASYQERRDRTADHILVWPWLSCFKLLAKWVRPTCTLSFLGLKSLEIGREAVSLIPESQG